MTSNLAVKPDTPAISPCSPRLPHALELTVLFREFVHYWTGFSTAIPELSRHQNLADPLEFATRWSGSIKGTLVLRTSRNFLEKLTKLSLGKEGNAGGNAPLQEMATLYSIFLVHYAWMDELFELGPILARPSQPSLWPSGEPHAFCAVEVEGEPIEIRLWIDDSKKGGE